MWVGLSNKKCTDEMLLNRKWNRQETVRHIQKLQNMFWPCGEIVVSVAVSMIKKEKS